MTVDLSSAVVALCAGIVAALALAQIVYLLRPNKEKPPMGTSTEDRPRAPALAYHVMAEVLPPEYFRGPPPGSGIRLMVTGRDNVRTVWDMPEGLAAVTCAKLKARADVRYHYERYTPAPEAA